MPTSFANNWCEFHENFVDILYNRHNEIFSSSKKFTILDSENTHFSQNLKTFFKSVLPKCTNPCSWLWIVSFSTNSSAYYDNIFGTPYSGIFLIFFFFSWNYIIILPRLNRNWTLEQLISYFFRDFKFIYFFWARTKLFHTILRIESNNIYVILFSLRILTAISRQGRYRWRLPAPTNGEPDKFQHQKRTQIGRKSHFRVASRKCYFWLTILLNRE